MQNGAEYTTLQSLEKNLPVLRISGTNIYDAMWNAMDIWELAHTVEKAK